MRYSSIAKSGFTLIELSIVLVIIGLIIGGVLVGQDLINAATIRAQLTQIDRYNTAAHAFQAKYGHLPGDIPDAVQYGLTARGTAAGEGDGNGVIEGNCAGNNNNGFDIGCGELPFFWIDLTAANLLDTSITVHGSYPSMTTPTYTQAITSWLPTAKIGNGNFVYIFSFESTNYFGISPVFSIGWTITSPVNTITVQQAYNIDSKIDDGLPQSGNVTACYVNGNIEDHRGVWAAGGGLEGKPITAYGTNCIPTALAIPPLSTNCYDNNGSAGTPTYAIQKNANLQNCAISFKFQ